MLLMPFGGLLNQAQNQGIWGSIDMSLQSDLYISWQVVHNPELMDKEVIRVTNSLRRRFRNLLKKTKPHTHMTLSHIASFVGIIFTYLGVTRVQCFVFQTMTRTLACVIVISIDISKVWCYILIFLGNHF